MERLEGHFTSYDHQELFFQEWKPNTAKGLLVITHGLAEHSECYDRLATELAQDLGPASNSPDNSAWHVLSLDLRGHGRSPGKRGYVANFDEYIEDLQFFYDSVVQPLRAPGMPVVFFGHSMGGLISARYALEHRPDISALVLSAPAFGLAVKVPRLKQKISEFAAEWVPRITLWNEVRYEDLTRDPEVLKSYEMDHLRHDKISPRLYLGMIESFQYIADHISQLQVPVLMQLAGKDALVSTPAAIRIYEKLSNKKNQLQLYHDSLHEIYNDLDRDMVIRDLKAFLSQVKGTSNA